MNFTEMRQTMTDEAYEIVSALSQFDGLTLQAIAFTTGQKEHTTQFILAQMAALGVAVENNGQWYITSGFKQTLV